MKKTILKALLITLMFFLPNTFHCQVNISSFTNMIKEPEDSQESENHEEITSDKESYDSNIYSKWFNVKEVKLYGAGNVLGLVTGNDDIDKTTAPTGSIGLNFTTSMLSCDLFFSYNGKQKNRGKYTWAIWKHNYESKPWRAIFYI